MISRRPNADEPEVVEVGGRRVRMRVQGDGPPLLLLNALTRPLESWAHLTQALSGRTIVSFDAPGVGGSAVPLLPLSMPGLAALAAAVLDTAGLDAVDVLGFSYGGAVAQQLAVDSPARVRRLILVSTTCGVGATPGIQPALRSLQSPSAARLWPRPNAVGTLWRFLAISGWSSIPFLGAIQVPTLVVCGSRDRLAPAANSVLLAQRIPGAELVVLPGGHDLQRAGPASALAGTAERFLAGENVRPPMPVTG